MDTSDQASKQPRRMRTSEEKRRIVEEALAARSLAAVARKHGVNANLLFGWRRLYQRGLLEQCREPAATLLPVKVTMPTVLADRKSRAARKVGSKEPAVTHSTLAGQIEIELTSGVMVRVHGHVEAAALQVVLSALGTQR